MTEAPAALQPALPPLDRSVLAHPGHPRTASARQQRLQTAVTRAGQLTDALTPHLPALDPPLRATVQGYLATLAKVIADELTIDGTGFATERPAKERGARRIASAVDLEATLSRGGPVAPGRPGQRCGAGATTRSIDQCDHFH